MIHFFNFSWLNVEPSIFKGIEEMLLGNKTSPCLTYLDVFVEISIFTIFSLSPYYGKIQQRGRVNIRLSDRPTIICNDAHKIFCYIFETGQFSSVILSSIDIVYCIYIFSLFLSVSFC